jgi:hypothetical protein
MPAQFIVRAQMLDATIKGDFDRWYQDEHLRDAHKAFGATRAYRGWSQVDPTVHYAIYEFDDLARANAIPGSTELKQLVAEFDRRWGNKVARTRDIIEVVHSIAN